MNWIKIYLSLCAAFILASCATIVPEKVTDSSLSPDQSTPSQYAEIMGIYNSGIIAYETADGKAWYRYEIKKDQEIGEIRNTIVTENKIAEYNNLIDKYKLRLLEKESYKIEKNAGVKPFIDKYGNQLWKIDAQHTVYFAIMKDWERNEIAPDSSWSKLIQGVKEKLNAD